VLVQHNVLWHAQTEDEEAVEVNVEECLMRLRFGKFIWLTTQIFGKAVWLILSSYERPFSTLNQAAEIVNLILDHGKLRPPDIFAALSTGDSKGDSIMQAGHTF
jgi:DNA-directed RNA polymerase III subunit RPC3